MYSRILHFQILHTMLKELPCPNCMFRLFVTPLHTHFPFLTHTHYRYHVRSVHAPHTPVPVLVLVSSAGLLPPCAHRHVPHHQLMPNISSHLGASASSHRPPVSQQHRQLLGRVTRCYSGLKGSAVARELVFLSGKMAAFLCLLPLTFRRSCDWRNSRVLCAFCFCFMLIISWSPAFGCGRSTPIL